MLEAIFVAVLGPNLAEILGMVLAVLVVISVVFKIIDGKWWWQDEK